MKNKRQLKIVKTLVGIVSGSSLLMMGSLASAAEDFPTQPLNMVVSYSAGGATDFQARIASSKSEQYLGEPTAIVNRPGAGGQVGWNYLVQKGKQDGYDIAAYNVPHFIAQSLMYDTHYSIDNLEPIANWGADPAVLIVGKDSQFDTVDELVNYAEENPGKVTMSGAGLFVGHHIAAVQLENAADIDLQYIPTSGGVDALRLVVGGQVMAGFNNLSDAYRNQDRLKILGVADTERHSDFLPDVPTFQESGYEVDDSSVNMRGVMAPSGVSEERLDVLSEKFVEMFNDEEIQAKLKKGGAPMRVMDREELKEMWKERKAYLDELFEGFDVEEIKEES
ncbi:tripartite tricarboxylate transporter substrate binding protein [Halomonas piscis]|uniref:Tripartite tricarboxylate transporter substrate binding protein n=1 Tax=Halomonas piscis TaxID=3031727 RepID=A0ABY9Z3R8_9GAMM|nr:tripartite tricarboxylate transporter substrate binding protein [Halomonas piscis]WNK21321.1 tripartite tricarboxylate transporter substrate binding protein [Halomonas piscis]